MKHILFFLILLGFLTACNDISDIGEDILDRDGILFSSNEDFDIAARTILDDTLTTFQADGTFPSIRFLGEYDDPIVGKRSAVYFREFLPSDLSYEFSESAVVDSVVLTLKIDSSECYGEMTNIESHFVIHEISEQIQPTLNYNSRSSISTYPTAIADYRASQIKLDREYLELLPNDSGVIDTIGIYEDVIRIPLDNEFGQKILNFDASTINDFDIFRKNMNGLKVRTLSSNIIYALRTTDPTTRFSIYYKEEGKRKIAHFTQSTITPSINTFNYEPSGASINGAFDDYSIGDSILYTSGMLGPSIEIDFKDLSDFKDRIINYAEIKVFAAKNEANTDEFPPLENLQLYYYNENGERHLVPDLQRALSSNPSQLFANIEAHFGGSLNEDNEVYVYTMNISEFAQQLIDDPDIHKLELTSLFKAFNSERTIIYGPQHSKYPIQIKFYFSGVK